jgi:plasmid stabilization system protein ParE
MEIRYEPEAEVELKGAAEFYLAHSTHLAERFLLAYEAAIVRILLYPHTWQRFGRTVRRCLVTNFPFQVIYRVDGEIIRIFAVAHQKRRPGYWRKRLNRP